MFDIIHGDLALENIGVIAKKGTFSFDFVLFGKYSAKDKISYIINFLENHLFDNNRSTEIDFGFSVVHNEDKKKKMEDRVYINIFEDRRFSSGIQYSQPLPSIQCEARDFWHDLDSFGTLIYELMGKTPWNTDEIAFKFNQGKFDEMIADMKAVRENCTHEDLKVRQKNLNIFVLSNDFYVLIETETHSSNKGIQMD